ncbi:MAG TPA: DNA primase [Thermodesulfovibrionales bacterium]|nr:DNA primase [Thermodesulfovibrionales bacterium]
MKSDGILEEIKSRIDIVEFVSDYVQLKKSGQNYKGLCPFHSEKTPSFMVSQVKQIFHCFGCGAGGDVVGFMMKHEGLSFREAVEYLAKKAGIRIKDAHFAKDAASGKREHILRLNEEAKKYFETSLFSSDRSMAYLRRRGINEESIRRFCIGYAPRDRDGLFRHLKKLGYADTLVAEAGLAVCDGRDCRDIFRDRIIFPIFNLKNDPVAFGGRVMDDSMPKYLNSPETSVFKKGENLFAISVAKEEIRKTGYAIIVEGYLDAIVCHQSGFRNTIAPLGTALTSKQLQKLKVLTKNVVLVFDADSAGIAAARRSLSVISGNDFRAKVMLLPQGEDPDSYLRKSGSSDFRKRLAQSMTPVEFLSKTSKSPKNDTVREILGIISLMKDLILADELMTELADRSGVHENLLRSELEKIRSGTASQSSGTSAHTGKRDFQEEHLLLSAIMAFPEKAGDILPKLEIDDLKDATVKALFSKIKSLGETFCADLLLQDADEPEKVLLTGVLLHPGFDPETIDRNIADCLLRIAQRRFEDRRITAISSEPDDIALHNSLLKEKRKLIRGVR